MWPILIPSIAAGIGGLFSHNSSQAEAPTTNPAYLPLRDQLLRTVMQRLQSPTGVPAGYETGGLQAINKSFNNAALAQENDLSARGLARSPIASAVTGRRLNERAATIGSFRSNIPLVARSLQNEDLSLAGRLLAFGTGQASQASYGGGPASGFENLAAMLGYLQATGAFKRTPAAGGGSTAFGLPDIPFVTGISGGPGNGLPGYNPGLPV